MLSILPGLDSASLNMENRCFAWMFVCVSLNLVTYVFFIQDNHHYSHLLRSTKNKLSVKNCPVFIYDKNNYNFFLQMMDT